ncbi:unnamed protein product, partial [Rotaria sp. Silwood2]
MASEIIDATNNNNNKQRNDLYKLQSILVKSNYPTHII